jgi:hypothetical protein
MARALSWRTETNDQVYRLYQMYPMLAEKWTPHDLLPTEECARTKSYLRYVARWLGSKPIMEGGYTAEMKECARRFAEENKNYEADDLDVKLAAAFLVDYHTEYFPARARMEEAQEKRTGIYSDCKDSSDVTYAISCQEQSAMEWLDDASVFIVPQDLIRTCGFVHRFSEHREFGDCREKVGELATMMKVGEERSELADVLVWREYLEAERDANGDYDTEDDDDSLAEEERQCREIQAQEESDLLEAEEEAREQARMEEEETEEEDGGEEEDQMVGQKRKREPIRTDAEVIEVC